MKIIVDNGLTKITLAFLLTWLCLPLYQVFNGHSFEIHRVGSDLIAGLSVVFVIFCLSGIIDFKWPRAAIFFAAVCYSLALLSSLLTELYFATTGQNLGADLFGYSLQEVLLTASASGVLEAKVVWYAVFAISFFVILNYLFGRITLQATRFALVATAVLGFISFPFSLAHVLRGNHANHENRILYLLTDWRKADHETNDRAALQGYPFLHEVEYRNPWKGYMSQTDSLPNFVFVIVEGLGSDFVLNGKYAGFTPFLDSLIQKSLYWKNGLSNAGRTFGVVPSVFGSLPYGDNGFMNLGQNMPLHQTLFTLLKTKGYHTNFFYGGNPNFDNLDLFLQHQDLDKFINASNFPNSIEATSSNTHWGYKDDQLFLAGTQSIQGEQGPRVDCYLTLSTHEPFECPDANSKKLADNLVKSRGGEFEENANIFECLLYTDQSLRKLFAWYAQRADFHRTVFVITGDHRMIPMETGNRLSRHHVPILVYSPLLNKPAVFSSLAIQSSITPSVLGYLSEENKMDFPAAMPFISKALSTDSLFNSDLDLPLIRVKNSVNDYINGKLLLADDQLYEINADLDMTPLNDAARAQELRVKLKDFQSKSQFAFLNNKLDSVRNEYKSEFTMTKGEDAFLLQQHIAAMNPDDKLIEAGALAHAKKYSESRSVLKSLLNQSPNYHDARLLLARTYGWQSKYDSAMYQVRETLKKSPEYADAFVVMSDLEYWQGNIDASLKAALSGLKTNPTDKELELRKSRATNMMKTGKKNNLTATNK